MIKCILYPWLSNGCTWLTFLYQCLFRVGSLAMLQCGVKAQQKTATNEQCDILLGYTTDFVNHVFSVEKTSAPLLHIYSANWPLPRRLSICNRVFLDYVIYGDDPQAVTDNPIASLNWGIRSSCCCLSWIKYGFHFYMYSDNFTLCPSRLSIRFQASRLYVIYDDARQVITDNRIKSLDSGCQINVLM